MKKKEFSMIRGWTLVIYGTATPPHVDDEPLIYRQPLSPPTQSPVFYNNYYRPVPNTHVNYNSMVNNQNPNRKTEQNINQNQQQKATTVMNSSSTTQQQQRKNGKQKNGKGNKNNNQRATSTTSRPNYSTVLWNQFQSNSQSKQSTPQQHPNNKNKLKIQSANANNRNFESDGTLTSTGFNRITTTMRPPRPTSKLPFTKNNQNLNANNNNNNYFSNTKYFEKSPEKAPKQMTENALTTADIDFITKPTQNPSFSKMFGKYEKIQQIYPELHPYKETQNIAAFSQQSAFSVSSNGKPSRENPKSFSNFDAAELPQKKNPNDVDSIIRQQSTSQISSNIRNGTGIANTRGHFCSIS